MGTVIVTDSCCDLPLTYFHKHKECVKVVGMPIIMEDVEYVDDMGESFTHTFFYERLKKGVMPTTSQINLLKFKEVFEEITNMGNDLIYLGFSSGMSGTFQNAYLALSMMKDEGCSKKMAVVDTLSASVGQGALLMGAVELLENQVEFEKIHHWIEDNKMKTHHWFAVDDLMHLKKGGRIPAATAVVGTMLNVKPILVLDGEGKLKNYASVRGQKKAMRFLVDKAITHLGDVSPKNVIVAHADAADEAEKMAAMLKETRIKDNITITELSATIASHVGPGMIAIAFISESIREF